VVCQIIWQAVKLGVGVSKQYHLEASSANPVPIGTRVLKGAIGVPRPVALNELGGGLARNF
jgi:tetrahydrodipicolinate N-succinyltransferase